MPEQLSALRLDTQDLFAADEQPGPALDGPLLGLAFDPVTAALRPLHGIPGAATIGEPFTFDFSAVRAAVSPAQNLALAVRADDAGVMLIQMAGGTPSAVRLTDVGAGPDSIVFGNTGAVAALYFASAGRVQVLQGLPDSPKVAREVDVSGFQAPLGPIAVSSENSTILLAAQDVDSQALYLIPAAGEARRLGAFGSVSAAQFDRSGTDVLVADGKADAVYRIRDAAGSGETVLLASEKDGLVHPVDLAASPDGRILVADDKAGAVMIIQQDGGSSALIPCGGALTGLSRLPGGNVFRLSDPGDGPVWILDTGNSEPRILAVPPLLPPDQYAASEMGGRE